jgi:hypothetical protein
MQFLLAEADTELSYRSMEFLSKEGTELERKTKLKCAMEGINTGCLIIPSMEYGHQ